MKLKALSAACLTLATACLIHAADPASKVESKDSDFLKMAAESGMKEVSLAELGMKKAADPGVKALAERMKRDHSALKEEIRTLASAKGVEISAVADPKGVEALKDLEKHESGDSFDKAFLNALRDGHEKSVENYKNASESAADASVKQFATKNLTVIQGHLDHIKQLQK